MHIAHVLSSFGLGGQERMAVDLARAQRAAGHQVHGRVAGSATGRSARPRRSSKPGVKALTVAKRGGFDVTLPIRLGRLFAREGVEVVHTHNPQALIYGAPAGKLAGAALIHTKHGRNPDSLTAALASPRRGQAGGRLRRRLALDRGGGARESRLRRRAAARDCKRYRRDRIHARRRRALCGARRARHSPRRLGGRHHRTPGARKGPEQRWCERWPRCSTRNAGW